MRNSLFKRKLKIMGVVYLIRFENLYANTPGKEHVGEEQEYSQEMHCWLKHVEEPLVQFLPDEHCVKQNTHQKHKAGGQK